MMITKTPNSINPSKQIETPKQPIVKPDKNNSSTIEDKFTLSESPINKATYARPNTKVDSKTIQKLKEETEKNYQNLKEIVRQLLERQGLKFRDILDSDSFIEVDEEAGIEALKAISEGGPLSPEAVSDRIVEFAKAISGGDKSKFEQLKSAITKGFNEAARILGGELPEISQKTYDLVMEKLNLWLEE